MNDKPHLDHEALAELKEVMEDEFDVLITTYLADSQDRIATLRASLENQDAEALTKAAHSFKGSSVNIGAPQLGELCLLTEKVGHSAQLDDAAVLLDRIEREYDTVRTLFEKLLNA
ncbi:Hpt domain-containing protein [Marinobacter sp. SS21]|nr:Hpt domain-containing protein [Marinobacter sp. SS21]MDC0662166.1 Hpt domain-containing protein [Marinobacter sp. SS21]